MKAIVRQPALLAIGLFLLIAAPARAECTDPNQSWCPYRDSQGVLTLDDFSGQQPASQPVQPAPAPTPAPTPEPVQQATDYLIGFGWAGAPSAVKGRRLQTGYLTSIGNGTVAVRMTGTERPKLTRASGTIRVGHLGMVRMRELQLRVTRGVYTSRTVTVYSPNPADPPLEATIPTFSFQTTVTQSQDKRCARGRKGVVMFTPETLYGRGSLKLILCGQTITWTATADGMVQVTTTELTEL